MSINRVDICLSRGSERQVLISGLVLSSRAPRRLRGPGAAAALGVRPGLRGHCQGQNYVGQLGTGDTTVHLSPVQAGTATNWASVSVGYSSACATRTDRTLWCWGSNLYGQLGLGNYTDQHSPVQVGTAANWATVSAQVAATACATRTDRTLWCWGDNTFGELGTGNTTSELSPVQAGTATSWGSVSAGNGANTCATRSDGTLWCWGANGGGELGTGSTTPVPSPIQVGTATSWAGVARGLQFGCAARTDHTLWCWGSNFYGQLGQGDTTDRLTPTEVQ